MPTINWNSATPAGADSVGLGAAEIRSLKTAIQTAIDAEHNFPAAGGDAGVHRLGSARPYVGSQSQVSSTGTDGRTMWTSDTSRYFHVGSGGTSFIGGAQVLSVGSYPGGAAPQRSYWAMEFGTGITQASGTATITYPSAFSDPPNVVASINMSTNTNLVCTVAGIFASFVQVTVCRSPTGSVASSVTVIYQAVGRRAL